MALYTEVSFSAGVYDDSTKRSVQHTEYLDVTALNTLNYATSHRVKLAASASDISVAFQSVTSGQLIALVSTSEFTVKINGSGNNAITLKPQTNTQTNAVVPGFLLMMANSITSLHLGNPAAVEILVDVMLVG